MLSSDILETSVSLNTVIKDLCSSIVALPFGFLLVSLMLFTHTHMYMYMYLYICIVFSYGVGFPSELNP